MTRPVAPTCRIKSKLLRTECEPSVSCSPYFGSPIACSILTYDQSASSSSATTRGRAVRLPHPISERCDDRHRALRSDRQPHVRLKKCPGRLGVGGPQRLGDQTPAEHESAAGQRALQESSSADITAGILDDSHAVSFAA